MHILKGQQSLDKYNSSAQWCGVRLIPDNYQRNIYIKQTQFLNQNILKDKETLMSEI